MIQRLAWLLHKDDMQIGEVLHKKKKKMGRDLPKVSQLGKGIAEMCT